VLQIGSNHTREHQSKYRSHLKNTEIPTGKRRLGQAIAKLMDDVIYVSSWGVFSPKKAFSFGGDFQKLMVFRYSNCIPPKK